MWDLPRSATEPMSPALAGRFFTTEPQGKPQTGSCSSFNIWLRVSLPPGDMLSSHSSHESQGVTCHWSSLHPCLHPPISLTKWQSFDNTSTFSLEKYCSLNSTWHMVGIQLMYAEWMRESTAEMLRKLISLIPQHFNYNSLKLFLCSFFLFFPSEMWFYPGGKKRSLSTYEDEGLRENQSAIEVYLLYFFIIIFNS